MNFLNKNKQKGFSLIDTVMAIAIMSLVFFGIFGVFRLSISILSNNKAKVGAISLANEQMEFVRSLSYDDVGTTGGIPNGNILQTESIFLNSINYTRRTLIQYVDDVKDGSGLSDENEITSDYKKAKVEISWESKGSGTKSFYLVSDIVPKGIETLVGGGTLLINVFDAHGIPIQGAGVNIVNSELFPPVSLSVFTNLDGKVTFPGSPSANNYEITVTKGGYSSSKTYGVDALNINPNPGHLSVLEGSLVTASFPIDLISSKTVKTFFAIASDFWDDFFVDLTKVSSLVATEISGGSVVLLYEDDAYKSTGSVFSNGVQPQHLVSWDEFSWDDNLPVDTEILYHLYYSTDTTNYNLIPETDLAGNTSGFSTTPIDISGLDISNYYDLEMNAVLNTLDASTTPSILDWGIGYTAGPTPFPNVPFSMEGEKTIGSDSGGIPIKKYSEDLQTDNSGEVFIGSLEWDNYLIAVDGDSFGYDISEICQPQPFSLEPNSTVTTNVILFPHSDNSLLVSVTDSVGNLLDGADVRLYRSEYDESQTVESCGQTFFGSLLSGTYSLDVSLAGYEDFTLLNLGISGTINTNVVLESL